MGGPILARGDQFWQQKLVWGTSFGKFSAKIGPARPILGGTDFGVTGLFLSRTLIFELLGAKLQLRISLLHNKDF